MGQVIDNYSLAQLRHLSDRSAHVSALFWAIPIGPWDRDQRQRLWEHFTTGMSLCHEVGLFLHVEKPTENDQAGADLASVVPPAGLRHIQVDTKTTRLLILGGQYPDPGWGVVLDVPSHRSSAWLDDLLQQATQTLDLSPLKDAIQQHLQYSANNKLAEEIIPSPTLVQQGTLLQRQRQSLRQLRAALSQGSLEDLLKALNIQKEMTPEPGAPWMTSSPAWREFGSQALGRYRLAIELHLRVIVGPALEQRIQTLRSPEEQAMLRQTPRAWAEGAREELNGKSALLEELLTIVGQQQERVREEEEQEARARENVLAQLPALRRTYAQQLNTLTGSLSRLIPRFLVQLEQAARTRKTRVKCVGWDPVRMVGWKIHTVGAAPTRIALFDRAEKHLESSAKERPALFDSQRGGDVHAQLGRFPSGDEKADGDALTDYVHLILSCHPSASSRDLTREMLDEVIDSRQRREIITAVGFTPDVASPRASAEELLVALGWPSEKSAHAKPLQHQVAQARRGMRFEPTSLRMSLESFGKDLVLTLVTTKLPGGWTSLPHVLREHDVRAEDSPLFEQLGKLTTGGAYHWLQAILKSLQLDHKALKPIHDVTGWLNPQNHHAAQPDTGPKAQDDICAMLESLLATTADLIGEMPWHLTRSQVMGQGPFVVRGEAWSHEHEQPRTVQVLFWEDPGQLAPQMLIWNRTRSNPLVIDPVHLSVPSGVF